MIHILNHSIFLYQVIPIQKYSTGMFLYPRLFLKSWSQAQLGTAMPLCLGSTGTWHKTLMERKRQMMRLLHHWAVLSCFSSSLAPFLSTAVMTLALSHARYCYIIKNYIIIFFKLIIGIDSCFQLGGYNFTTGGESPSCAGCGRRRRKRK